MNVAPKRSGERETRAERALATRRRMIAAGYRQLCAKGFLGATMAAVAADAGVAVQTVYYTFHTKADLLGEVLGAAVVGFDDWRGPPPEPIPLDDVAPMLPWWHQLESAPDAAAALRIFVRHGTDVLERVAPLVPALHAGASDPDAATVVYLAEQRRMSSYRSFAEVLAGKGDGLRPEVRVSDATDILVVLFSAEVYRSLAAGRGWPRARCESFLRDLLARQLL